MSRPPSPAVVARQEAEHKVLAILADHPAGTDSGAILREAACVCDGESEEKCPGYRDREFAAVRALHRLMKPLKGRPALVEYAPDAGAVLYRLTPAGRGARKEA